MPHKTFSWLWVANISSSIQFLYASHDVDPACMGLGTFLPMVDPGVRVVEGLGGNSYRAIPMLTTQGHIAKLLNEVPLRKMPDSDEACIAPIG